MHPKLRFRKMPALRAGSRVPAGPRRIESDVILEEIPPALATTPPSRGKTAAGLRVAGRSPAPGADPGQDQEILDGLVADGLLVEA